MAQPSNNASSQKQHKLKQEEEQLVKPMFHDFLGMKPSPDSPVVLLPKGSDSRLTEASPSASASLGASSGGGRGPISTTSDLGSGQSLLISNKDSSFFFTYAKKTLFSFLFSFCGED